MATAILTNTDAQCCPNKPICSCGKPVPCSCPGSSHVAVPSEYRLIKFASDATQQKGTLLSAEDSMIINKKGVSMSSDKIAKDFLKQLPVYADDSTEDKKKRKDMIKGLVNELEKLKNDDDYEKKAKDDIKECIEKLPMWHPEAKKDHEMFINNLTDDFYDRFAKLQEKNKIKDIIAKWLNSIHFTSEVHLDDILDDFFENLNPYVDSVEEMKTQIKDRLQEMPILNKNEVVDALAEEMANDLHDLAYNSTEKLNDSKDKPEEIPISIDEEIISLAEESANVVNDIESKSMEGNKRPSLKDPLVDKMSNALNEVTSKLAEKKINSPIDRKVEVKEMPSLRLQEMNSEYKDEFQAKPGLKKNKVIDLPAKKSTKKFNDTSETTEQNTKPSSLEKMKTPPKLTEITISLDDKIRRNKSMDDIKKYVSKRPIVKKKEVVNTLANNFNNTSPKPTEKNKTQSIDLMSIPSMVSTNNMEQAIQKEISDLFKDIPNMNQNKSKEIKDKIANILSNNFDDLSENGDAHHEISNTLQKEAKMPKVEAAKLATAFIDKVKDPSKSYNLRSKKIDEDIDQIVPSAITTTANGYSSGQQRTFDQGRLNDLLSDLFENIPNVSPSKQKEIHNKVADIISRNKHLPDKKGNIQHEIANILKKEALLSDKDANNLASAVTDGVNKMPLLHQSQSPFSRAIRNKEELEKLVSNEVRETLKNYNLDNKITNKVRKSIEELLADQIVRGTDGKITQGRISAILTNANISQNDADDISNKLLDRNKQLSLSYSNQDSKSLSPIERDNFEEKAEKEILGFLEDSIGEDNTQTKQETRKQVKELVRKLGELMSDPYQTDKEAILDQITPYLQDILKDHNIPIKRAANKLANRIQDIDIKTSTPKGGSISYNPRKDIFDVSSIQKDHDSAQKHEKTAKEVSDHEVQHYTNQLTDTITEWMDELPVDLSATEDKGFKETMIQDLVGDIVDRQKYLQLHSDAKSSDADDTEHLKYQVFKWLNKLLDLADISSVMQQIDPLMTKIKEIYVPQLLKRAEIDKFFNKRPIFNAKKPSVSKAADILFDNIESWCDNLPIKADTPKDIEKAKQVKQDIASKLIHKIGELNMNPEVFNDDFLYEDMLEDEIDNLLTDISSENIQKNLPALINDLMTKVKEVRKMTRDEIEGQNYKQKLRSQISNTFQSYGSILNEIEDFDILIDDLVDVFTNLHYVDGNEGYKNKYKEKIKDEVNQFCNDYLKKHPGSPIDNEQLNQDLYKALKRVSVPKEETIREEVEISKVKDKINEWVRKDLPMMDTPEKRIQANKMVAVLAKKIHDIEKQSDEDSKSNAFYYDDIIEKEIKKWIQKPPFNIDGARDSEVVEKLMNDLKATKKSRRVSAPNDIFYNDRSAGTSKTSPFTDYSIPPTSLSLEDQAHLQQVRKRSAMPRAKFPPTKDASVSPLPMDAGSQTEMRPGVSQPTDRRLSKQNSGVQTHPYQDQSPMQAVGSQAEIAPHVIIREYYWDSLNGSQMTGVPSPSQFSTQATGAAGYPSSPGLIESQTPQSRLSRRECAPCPRREIHELHSEDLQEPCSSRPGRSQEPRVTRLGSFDDMNPKCTLSRTEWKFSDEDEFWADKRRFLPDDDTPFIKERRKEEEKSKCRCREQILTKCYGRRKVRSCQAGQSTDDTKMCSKCCGIHCPHPTYMYFRQ